MFPTDTASECRPLEFMKVTASVNTREVVTRLI